jgi:hypothetical protein
MHRINQLTFDWIYKTGFYSQSGIGFNGGKVNICTANRVSLQQKPFVVAIHQPPGDSTPGSRIIMQVIGAQAFFSKVFGKEFQGGSMTAQSVGCQRHAVIKEDASGRRLIGSLSDCFTQVKAWQHYRF